MSVRRRLVAITLVLVLALVSGGVAAAEESLAVSVTLQVIASDAEATAVALADWADTSGGYFTSRSEEIVVLRLPPALVPELRSRVESRGDTIVRYDPSAVDYREELARLDAAINSRAEALDRILGYMDQANVRATLSFERELRSLLDEVEYYTGQQRRISNEVAYASATVYLSSRKRTIPEQLPSSFGWVNTVDLYGLLDEAQWTWQEEQR